MRACSLSVFAGRFLIVFFVLATFQRCDCLNFQFLSILSVFLIVFRLQVNTLSSVVHTLGVQLMLRNKCAWFLNEARVLK